MCNGALCGEALEEVVRRPHGEIRWCFTCRSRQSFEFIVNAPIEMSYYGPIRTVECVTCKTVDGDLFPGRFREWED